MDRYNSRKFINNKVDYDDASFIKSRVYVSTDTVHGEIAFSDGYRTIELDFIHEETLSKEEVSNNVRTFQQEVNTFCEVMLNALSDNPNICLYKQSDIIPPEKHNAYIHCTVPFLDGEEYDVDAIYNKNEDAIYFANPGDGETMMMMDFQRVLRWTYAEKD